MEYLSTEVKRIFIFSILSLISTITWGKEADTLLNKVISKPYVYNIVQNEKGDIFLGTAAGIYAVGEDEISQFDTRSGYVGLDAAGRPKIDSSGISNHESFRYLHLLPYPEEKRQIYYSSTETQFYIVSGGRIFIFDIVPYAVSYRNQSIRSISRNLVGGYSGVYYKGARLESPTYTDGYIREFGDTAFVCYGGLFMITPSGSRNFLSVVPYGGYIDSVYIGYLDDIYFDAPHGVYFLSTNTGVYIADQQLKHPRLIQGIERGDPVVLLGSKESFLFTRANRLYAYSFENGQISAEDSTTERILGGVKLSNRLLYTLSSSTLYYSTTSHFFEPVAKFTDVHTLWAISEKELIIAGNQGLYLYNSESRTTSPVIQGVEFNKRALYADNDRLYAGSVNGLYTIDLKQIHRLINRNKVDDRQMQGPFWLITGIAIIVLFGFLWIIFRLKRRLNSAEQLISEVRARTDAPEEKKLDREMIAQFIRSNLSTASIKSINEHFGSNTNQIYSMLEPDKPGTIIQALRMELVIDMKKRGESLADIAEATGFSQSYIKKIKITDPKVKDISADDV